MPSSTPTRTRRPSYHTGMRQFTAFAAAALGFLNHSTDLWLAGLATRSDRSSSSQRPHTMVAHATAVIQLLRDLYQGLRRGEWR